MVLSICQAALVCSQPCLSKSVRVPFLVFLIFYVLIQEAFVWVLLDGGPSRAFFDSDIPMMEDDLNMLKVWNIFCNPSGLILLASASNQRTANVAYTFLIHICYLFSFQFHHWLIELCCFAF